MSERDTHFAGFAKLLMKEMLSQTQLEYMDFNSDDTEDVEMYRLIIARRTYDLMYFMMEGAYGHRENFENEIHQSVKMLPDITEWPKIEER